MPEKQFTTDFKYTDRKSKYEYVYKKYGAILTDSILDIGSDQSYLKDHLGSEIKYTGVAMTDKADIFMNLEEGKIPCEPNSYECVMCLDVLEHIENCHDVFDQMCAISKKYVLIALPNPWSDFWGMLRYPEPNVAPGLKFYGLPQEKPEDRHKWFFSKTEAEEFISYRAKKNGMNLMQMDFVSDWTKNRPLRTFMMRMLFRKDLNLEDITPGKVWALLEKK